MKVLPLLVVGVFVAAGCAYVTRAPASLSGCTYDATLMDRGTKLAASAGSAIHSLNGPVPTAKISDTVRGTWQTLGFWVGVFGAAVQGRTAPVKAPAPCTPQCPTGGQTAPDPASLSAPRSGLTGATLAADAARAAGFPEAEIPMAVAVAKYESGFNPEAVNNWKPNAHMRGMWQIYEEVHPDLMALGNWADPYVNAKMAYRVWSDAGRSWSPWSTAATARRNLGATPALAAIPPVNPPAPQQQGCSGNPDATITTWNSLGCYRGEHCNSDANVVRGFTEIAKTATVISGQELPSEQRRAKIRAALPGWQMTSDGTAVPIMWDTSRYTFVKQGKVDGLSLEEGGPKAIVYVQLVDKSGIRFSVVNTHIRVHPTEREYALQVGRVTALVDRLGAAGEAVMVTGDWNAQGDPGLRMGQHGLTSNFQLLGRHATHGNRAIDEVWAVGAQPSMQRVLPSYGSDHHPVQVTFVPAASAGLGGPETDTPAGWDFPGNNTVDQAVNFMEKMAQHRTRIPSRMCLHYVGVAYGHNGTAMVKGRHWAIDVFDSMPARYKHAGRSVPPRGALVFWRTGGPGHIAISLGNGQVASTDFNGSRYQAGIIGFGPISAIDKWGPRAGWTAPVFRGQTRTGEIA